MSLDAFSRAKRSTYDKRVVLEKRRNLAAAKVNKYRKIEKRLGKSVEVSDAFDPEKYAARLDALERDLPTDDGFGRGRRGRQTVSTTDFSHANHQREGSTVVPARLSKKDAANDDAESDSDGAFRDNVVFPANKDADADEDAEEDQKKKETNDAKDERRDPNQSKSRISNKGWNKAVKEGLKKNARREEKAREMAALREKWAAENAAKRAFFERRDATRDKFRKKNSRGQPVMRHRVDKILEQLQKDA